MTMNNITDESKQTATAIKEEWKQQTMISFTSSSYFY